MGGIDTKGVRKITIRVNICGAYHSEEHTHTSHPGRNIRTDKHTDWETDKKTHTLE